MISSSRDISEENLEITHLSGPIYLLSFVLICEGTFWSTVLSFAGFLATMINLLGAVPRIWMKELMKNTAYTFFRLDCRVIWNTTCLLGVFINLTEIRSIHHLRKNSIFVTVVGQLLTDQIELLKWMRRFRIYFHFFVYSFHITESNTINPLSSENMR